MNQLEGNLVAGDLQLTDEQTARLTEVSAPHPDDYPYGPFGVLQRDRYIHSSEQALVELDD